MNSQKLAKRFRRLYAGVVYDAMTFDLRREWAFVLDRNIKPLVPPRRPMVGPAMTCRGEPCRKQEGGLVRDRVRLEMFKAFTPGCVQVISTARYDSVAHFGDISAQLARQHGAVGAVIDGYTRDAQRIARQKFPVACRGVRPEDAYGRWWIRDYGGCLLLAGNDGCTVAVHPGDWIFADADGVLVIPQNVAEKVCCCAERRAANERTIRKALLRDLPEAVYRRLGRW